MGSIKRYLKFVKPYRFHIFLTIAIGIIKFGIPLILPFLLKYVVDNIINSSLPIATKSSHLIYIMLIAFGIFVIVRPPIEYFRQYYAQYIGSRILFDIRDHLFKHLQKLSLRYYANAKTGEVISRVINDVESTKDFVITGLMNVWLDLITILITVTIMLTMDVKLTLVSLIVLPFYTLAVKYFFGRLRFLTRQRSQALAVLQGFLTERIQGMQVTRSFALEDYESGLFKEKNGEFLDRALKHTGWNARTFTIINTLTDIGPLLIIGFSAYQVIHGHLTLGEMVAFVGYIDRLYDPLRRLANSSTALTQSFASMDRVFELMDEKYDIVNRDNPINAKKLDGQIHFNQVSFQYNDVDDEVIQDVTFQIEPGQKIALVGSSGGGKSSLVSLIPRFYDVTKGSIKIDGVDIRDYDLKSMREKIGIVLQDNFLFSDTVKSNIRYGNPSASEEEIIAAAKAANAHDFIMSLPDGYDTLVGERGVKLSGGQKQRVAIARVFLRNPSILIFDEATSALDLENERYIQDAIHELAMNRTTIFIAHRLSTITHVDKIVYIDQGQIVEIGSHEELMAKKEAYYHLFEIQNLEISSSSV
ncbi:multidrug ABC transporter ATP-binding protein [Bacillus sp. FJAT-25509]|uniref:ABC transporter ATP-binding protein n=1 Tax=Bacillus sp. FJAT-25509 TaxID=1712029 RepID=UPI0006F285C3|nr:ABC transporter ATP-binding protein [Bacillus sp. FJAT-25509]KQL41154.1 multidrug ABC transporter ATP-binding protein [Bacillus sp. FJAT-25509]